MADGTVKSFDFTLTPTFSLKGSRDFDEFLISE
jgi:hypothetical protein